MDLIEFLTNKRIIAVSNYKITPEIENFISKYDCIIRFNTGSNLSILKEYDFYNNRTDISVLSGWYLGDFGPIDGFTNQKVLFSRPKCFEGIKHQYKYICVKQNFEDNIKKYAESINYIPLEVFYEFYDLYNYDEPTTGLIVLYYIKKYIAFNIECVNFFVDNNLKNIFTNKNGNVVRHNIQLEKKILSDLNINNIIIN